MFPVWKSIIQHLERYNVINKSPTGYQGSIQLDYVEITHYNNARTALNCEWQNTVICFSLCMTA